MQQHSVRISSRGIFLFFTGGDNSLDEMSSTTSSCFSSSLSLYSVFNSLPELEVCFCRQQLWPELQHLKPKRESESSRSKAGLSKKWKIFFSFFFLVSLTKFFFSSLQCGRKEWRRRAKGTRARAEDETHTSALQIEQLQKSL